MFLKNVIVILAGIFKVDCKIHDILLENSDINNANNLSQCVVDIINNNFYKTISFSYENVEREYFLHTSILTEIAANVIKNGIPIAYLNANNESQTEHLYEENSIVISTIETCESMIDVIEAPLNDNKYLMILNGVTMDECEDTFKNIASKVADYQITFIHDGDVRNVYKISTYINTLDAKTCELKSNTKLIQLNICRNGSLENKSGNTFPDKKPKDWMNCTINVGLGCLFPYTKSCSMKSRNYDVIKVAAGSDVEILKMVAQYLNASLKFFHINADTENGHFKMSFLKLLFNGSLDICAGGLYRVYGDIVSYSGVYSRQELVWVYSVERIKASWVVFMYKSDEVYIFIVFYIGYSIIWYIMRRFDEDIVSISSIFVYAWGTLFGAASLQQARTIKQKILNLFYLILCLHLYAYTTIELFPFLTIQGPPQKFADTDEISKSGKPVYLRPDGKYFVDDEKYFTVANKSEDCTNYDDCIVKILENKGTTVLSDGILAPVQVNTAVNGEAKVVKTTKPILVVYHEMIINKESTLLGRFEKIVTRLFQFGLCEKLYKDSFGLLVLDEARRASRNIFSNSYTCEGGCKITLSQCAGAFYAWMLGCVMSCCAFCAEIIIKKKQIVSSGL